jgi:hypothetical protein
MKHRDYSAFPKMDKAKGPSIAAPGTASNLVKVGRK